MADPQLILKFRMDGAPEWLEKEAARISVNRGVLTLFGQHPKPSETIPLSRIEALSIRSAARLHIVSSRSAACRAELLQ